MERPKLKIALVGCGQIADAHLQEIPKTGRGAVVAVCDQQADLAGQAAARFDIPGVYVDLARMLDEVKPDVVHVTTPPHSHRAIALQCLAAGAHVYVEKPFTVDVAEADAILAAADAAGRSVCVGHDQIFDPIWEECRAIHARGDLGRVVHVDSVRGYDLSGAFGRIFMSEPDHWVHRLPGGLAQNNISHAVYKVTEFLPDEAPRVWAHRFAAPGTGGHPVELRAMLRGAEVTANLVFTATARPVQRIVRVYGTRAGIEVDFEGRTLRRFRTLSAPGAFAKIQAPARQLAESSRALMGAGWKFARSRIHYFAGMCRLFTLFYQSIQDGTAPPIPPREVRRVTAIMDEIFRTCREDELSAGAGGGGV